MRTYEHVTYLPIIYPFAHVVFWQNNKIMLGVAGIDV